MEVVSSCSEDICELVICDEGVVESSTSARFGDAERESRGPCYIMNRFNVGYNTHIEVKSSN